MKEELKKIYISLAQTIESGDTLKIGIVIGQVLSKLENLINDYDTTTGNDDRDRHTQGTTSDGRITHDH